MSWYSQRALLAAVALVLTTASRPALAACGAAGGCPRNLASVCCRPQGTSCELDGTISVTDGVCELNFDGRDVTLSGVLDVGENVVTIRAGSLTVTGQLRATGIRGMIMVKPPAGGTLGRAGTPGLSLTDGGQIDLSGTNGATLTVDADGAVTLMGGAGSMVTADATDPAGAGGRIDITSRGDSITVGMPLSLEGGTAGLGGTLGLHAGKDLTFTPSATPVSVAGGFDGGGTMDLDGGGMVVFQRGSKVQAMGLATTGGSGGEIDIAGGTIDAEGVLDATGGTGADTGGDGGLITIEARHGPLTLVRPPRSGLGGVAVDAAPGGDSGEVDLTTDSPVSGAITISAPISAQGGTTSLNESSGGTISVDAASTLTVNSSLDVSASTGDPGEIDLNPSESPRNGDVLINAKLDGSATSGGGVLVIGSGHDIEFTASSSVIMKGGGGEVTVTARNDLTVDGAQSIVPIDASGTGDSSGGTITLIAGRSLSVHKGAALIADGGGVAGACGGRVTLKGGAGTACTAGRVGSSCTANVDCDSVPGAGDGRCTTGDPDRPGDLTIDGQVSATGSNCSAPPTAPCNDTNDDGCSIIAEGCQVTITGGLDSTDAGSVPSANLLIGRKGISITGTGAVRAGGSNAAYSSTAPLTAGVAHINPALGPCVACTAGLVGQTCAVDTDCDTHRGARDGRCTGGCVRPPCTGRDPTTQALVPEGCVVPCPVCGNGGAREFPEQCDDGNNNECDGCDPHCRLPTRATCDDGKSCTSDAVCDPKFGCLNDPVPEGTACEDGNLCTVGDVCQAGACNSGDRKNCDDLDACTMDSCARATGCKHDPISCEDHNPCTLGPDTCDPKTGCQHGALKSCPPGTVCDPKTANGDCVQKPCSPDGPNTVCDDENPCTTDVCENGLCKSTVVQDGTACDNTTLCDGHETCKAGVCTPGPPPPPDCDDGNPCTTDRACDAATGCTDHNDPIDGCVRCQPGDLCDDGITCYTDTCLPEGICSHQKRADCCTVDQECADRVCMKKSCDQGTGKCIYTPTPGVVCGGGCQGADLAVGAGTCDHSGACCDNIDPGVCPPQIDVCPVDDDVCTDDICDPDVGKCVHRRIPPPDCCHNDGECDDHNGCTKDACKESRCTYDLVSESCVPCADDTDCGGRCLGRACVGGVCTDVTPFLCPTPGTGCRLVAGQPVCRCSDSRGCDDGNVCNGKETCVTATGTCVPGTPLKCDDNNVCTDDSCNPATGCVNTTQSGFEGIASQLTAVESAVNAAAPPDLTPSLAKVIRAKTDALRAKVIAAHAAAGGSAKREGRMLKAANKALQGLTNAIRNGRKGRKQKISASLAGNLLGRLGCTGSAVQGLQTELSH